MDIPGEIQDILSDILDIEEQEITPDAYIVRELGAESIDLLELAVALNSRFHIEIKDDEIFLTSLRLHVIEAEEEGRDVIRHLVERLPFLDKYRVKEIMGDLEDGPTLKVKDLISYVEWRSK